MLRMVCWNAPVVKQFDSAARRAARAVLAAGDLDEPLRRTVAFAHQILIAARGSS
jgi:hypothetical protein